MLSDELAVGADDGLGVDAPEVSAAHAGDGGIGLGLDVHFLRAQEAAVILEDVEIFHD